MRKKILAMSLVLVIVFAFTACTEGVEEEAGLPSAQEIVDGVIEALDDIRTYQLDMDMTIDLAGEVGREAGETTMVIDFSGTADMVNRQMRGDMTLNRAATGEDEAEMGMEFYFIDDMLYMMVEVPEMDPRWMKSEMPEGTWEEMSQVEDQIELLETAQVKVIGRETVGGVDCYVLQVTPDLEQLWQIAMQQKQIGDGGLPDVAEEALKEMFRSFSVKQWVAKDTYFLTRVEIDMDVELTPEAFGFPGEEGVATMDIAISLQVYNYNKPVAIVLPPEAEEAIEVPQ